LQGSKNVQLQIDVKIEKLFLHGTAMRFKSTGLNYIGPKKLRFQKKRVLRMNLQRDFNIS